MTKSKLRDAPQRVPLLHKQKIRDEVSPKCYLKSSGGGSMMCVVLQSFPHFVDSGDFCGLVRADSVGGPSDVA